MTPPALARWLRGLRSILNMLLKLYAYSPLPFTCTANRARSLAAAAMSATLGKIGYLECSSDQLLSCGRFPTTRFGALGRGFLKSGARIHLYRITIAGPLHRGEPTSQREGHDKLCCHLLPLETQSKPSE